MNQEILIKLEQAAEKLVLDIPAALDDADYTALFNEKFAELIVKDCVHYLNSEIERLAEYQNSLSQIDYDRRADCELAIEKCLDNIEGLKQHFGIE